MVIMAICFVPVAIACIFIWRHIDVRKRNNSDSEEARDIIW